jgi:uncharacterized protein
MQTTFQTPTQSLHWQTALGGDGIAENIQDINQSIRVILGTAKGSDLLRPDFGSDLNKYIDWPIDRAIPHLVRETVQAIAKWEKRIASIKVTVIRPGIAHLALKIIWKLEDATAGELELSL